MKRTTKISLLAVIVSVFFAIGVYAAMEGGNMMLTPGDEVYACDCGPTCDCNTLSKNPGKCTCNKDLVKSKVMKAEKGMVELDVNGKEQTFRNTGKYACACGPNCTCDTISQKPGNCTCGKPMKPVMK